ncbi:hypothetical protein JHJ32_07215 [Parapedobacter sp. ISTM3]|uniref:Uncharacterized protein n=1 Tax=Parapedobacter luteus TaxID=623280 RepID=A0A1T5BT74_9SPHI|nr:MULTISPECIES: hypothetical protein [Parapedobacter]MBK1439767.1 hypothetical protein [Parapedobacter sp. ISTM3]SKB50367.1 hypothetical protein SAMN05660226_01724 [Parapedobacter luteus]
MKTSGLYQLTLLLCAIVVTLSCRNESRDSAENAGSDAAAEIAEENQAPLPSLPYIAVFDEASEQLGAEKNPDFDGSPLTIEALTQALITNYPEITIVVRNVSNDTLYLQIPDAQYLTQQMGSSGSQMYLLEATYAYTELPGINAVNFGFEEGDHAIPGTYTRKHFEELRALPK